MTTPTGPPAVPPPAPDPLKGLRGVMAGTLVLEAIVVALALPVVARLGTGIGTTEGGLVIGLAAAMLLASGLLRKRWGLAFALVLQLAMVASFFAVFALGVLGVLFSVVWAYLLWLRRDVATRIAEGRLPSQQ